VLTYGWQARLRPSAGRIDGAGGDAPEKTGSSSRDLLVTVVTLPRLSQEKPRASRDGMDVLAVRVRVRVRVLVLVLIFVCLGSGCGNAETPRSQSQLDSNRFARAVVLLFAFPPAGWRSASQPVFTSAFRPAAALLLAAHLLHIRRGTHRPTTSPLGRLLAFLLAGDGRTDGRTDGLRWTVLAEPSRRPSGIRGRNSREWCAMCV